MIGKNNYGKNINRGLLVFVERLILMTEMIPVAFDTDDWENFAKLLEESVPEEYGFDFGIGPDPLLSHWFCGFIHKIKRPWTLRSQLYGHGYQCLRVNRERLNCVGITAVHAFTNEKQNFYRWLRWPTLLARAGYDVKVEVEKPGFVPNEDLVRNATHGLVELELKSLSCPDIYAKGC